ncbi:TPA: YraN family protein [Candidatus Uhrbacteria bacterium]|nr:YraN family protein [Candidatus Uhrbacteria bacterium]
MVEDARKQFGNKGESLAASFLKEKGMRILTHQYRSPVGEIDLICLDGEELVFVEVKTRSSQVYGFPEESITPKKIQHLLHVAQHYLQQTSVKQLSWRIDVIAISYSKELSPEIMHFPAIDIPEQLW